MTQANPYPLRIEKSVMEKFKIVSSSNGRSINKEIEMLIRKAVSEYEKDNGEIKVDLD